MTGSVDTYAAGTKQLVEDAQRLGLSWILRPGTVAIADPLKVIFDGDDTPITAVSLIGMFPVGARVMGLLVPPGGNFIIGWNDPDFTGPLGVTTNLNQAGGTGTTTSGTFVDMPGSPTLSITKKYPSGLTNIKASLTTGASSSAINDTVSFALLINGVDQVIMTTFINVAAVHVYFASTILLTGLDAGTYSVVVRWRRVSGAGTLSTDVNDWTSLTLEEVWAV